MKNYPPDQPRFTCRLVRGCLAVLGDTTAGTPRGPGAAHVATCADCQEYFSAGNELELALKRDAVREWREAPANLEQDILRAVRSAGSRERKRVDSANPRLRAWSLAGAAACAVVAALVYQQKSPSGTLPETAPPVAMTATADPAMLSVARRIVAAVPTDLFVQMQPRAQALLRQDPLQNEVEAVKSDARTAVRFLARNFLPTPADEPSRGG